MRTSRTRNIGISISAFLHSNRAAVAPNTNFTFQICAASAALKISRIWPLFASLSKSFSSYRWVETQASEKEQESTDEVFNQLLSGVENDLVSSKKNCAAYIEKLCSTGSLSDVARLLQSLHHKQIFLYQRTYNIVLTAAGETKNFEISLQIFKDLLLISCNFLGPTSYSILAQAFSDVNNYVPLLKFVGEVSQEIFPQSVDVINRIIFAFGKTGQIDKAMMIFDYMKNLESKPDVVTYNTVLDILGRAGKVDDMLNQYAVMKETSVVPDIISYNTLINSLRKMGRLDKCLVLLREMGASGVNPDLQTYTALIESFGRLGRVEEALKLFGEMKGRGIPPSVYIYRGLNSNLKKVGKSGVALSLFEEMSSCVSDCKILI